MLKPLCLAILVLCATVARADGDLTAREARWIAAGMPVVRHGLAQRLPLDIVVQPGLQPGASPIAMGVHRGRCKLVLSLRGNAGADALERGIAPGLFHATVEAVFAHEVGHCWRHVKGRWGMLPGEPETSAPDPGLADASPEGVRGAAFSDTAQQRAEMGRARFEEGYADLVALSWTRRAHPARYAAILAWLERFRADDRPGEHHDTRSWLRLAADPGVFAPDADLFRSAEEVWERGLRATSGPSPAGALPAEPLR